MIFIGAVCAGVVVSAAFLFKALNENLLFYYSPTEVAEGDAPVDRRFRLGGLVAEGSLKQTPGTLQINFLVTDNLNSIPVEHYKIPPDLFQEGKGVVVHGTINEDGLFIADELVAKHDENYMSPEVAESLAEAEERAGY
jgi:cytochrome c-type biogenesis protein CcmE